MSLFQAVALLVGKVDR